MNFHITGHDDWATAPPSLRAQIPFNAMFYSRAVCSNGVTSPPIRISMMYKNNLKNLRSGKTVTQTDISAALSIGQAEYSRMESGKRKIYPHKTKIAEYLKISEDEIMESLLDGTEVDRRALSPTLPVYGFPLPDGKGFDWTQQMMSKVDRPECCAGYVEAYACFCFGECLAPQINNGDLAFVNPTLEPRSGGLVVVCYKANGKERGLLCRFLGEKAGNVCVEWRDGEETFASSDISVHPVVSVQYAL